MKQIKSIKFAFVKENGRIATVGSSGRPATFSSLHNANKAMSIVNSLSDEKIKLVELTYETVLEFTRNNIKQKEG